MSYFDTSSPSARRIPVTLLTGFLGSGKTTLLNQLVQQPSMSRALVIINEFGEIGLDHQLFSASTDGEQIELSNGCICCSIRTDLAKTLAEAVWRFSREGKRQFDRLIIETTGLADPAPIVHTLMSETRVARHYALDGIVTTMDAVSGSTTLDRHEEALRQAAMADMLLITKQDVASKEQLDALCHRLSAINPSATQKLLDHGRIDADALLGLGPEDMEARSADIQRWLGEASSEASVAHSPTLSPHALFASVEKAGVQAGMMPAPPRPDPNRHDDHIRAHCFVFERPIRASRLEAWLSLVTSLMGHDMLRIKGMLDIEGRDRPLVIHGVQHLFHPPVELEAWPGGERFSRLIFITRDIPRETLEMTLGDFLDN
ncbi:CobW family GTP-binding protein [Kushneria marisflavi]|uniref:GTP-binding protein n=1 Tax=Kushneria marisflavi TaxID=157779 RepID=A0A240UNP5_9GAMM|nr:GTP-binding protein [Kushneria marisflavi]ART62662.1 GTP-binding protein [Kushneria marisflavi]RKD83946.1 G3E family GTPase [Kushneria marisflavi]